MIPGFITTIKPFYKDDRRLTVAHIGRSFCAYAGAFTIIRCCWGWMGSKNVQLCAIAFWANCFFSDPLDRGSLFIETSSSLSDELSRLKTANDLCGDFPKALRP